MSEVEVVDVAVPAVPKPESRAAPHSQPHALPPVAPSLPTRAARLLPGLAESAGRVDRSRRQVEVVAGTRSGTSTGAGTCTNGEIRAGRART